MEKPIILVSAHPDNKDMIKKVDEYHRRWNLLTTPRKFPSRPCRLIDEFIEKCEDNPIYSGEFATIRHTEICQLTLSEYEAAGDDIGDEQRYKIVNGRIFVQESGPECKFPMNSRLSVLIEPFFPPSFLSEMNGMLPDDIFPTPDDDEHTVLKRNDDCPWLDEVWRHGYSRPTNGDKGSKQPCRRTVSIAYDNPSIAKSDGRYSTKLHVYTCREMPANKWQVRPASNGEYAKVLEIWRVAWPFLRGPSRVKPPNAWQYVIYQRLLGRIMGKHRDNFSNKSLERMRNDRCPYNDNETWSGFCNSQIYGSSVIIYSFGNCPMEMSFYCLAADGGVSQQRYRKSNQYSFKVGEGQICILFSIDDLLMKHGLSFPVDRKSTEEQKVMVRAALVIRWLDNWQEFYADTSTIRLGINTSIKSSAAMTTPQWMNRSAWT